MKINLPLWISGVLLLYISIITILSSIWSNFNLHIKANFPSVTITFLNVLLGSAIAIGGVFWAFNKNTERAYKIQVDTFRRSFAAVMSESAENQAIINKLKKEISPTHFNLQVLSDEIAGSLLTNPMLYKFTGNEYLYALRTYLANVKLVNKMLNFVFEDFKADGRILDENIKDLNSFFDDCLYYLYLLQYQTQVYVYSYDVKFGPKPSNYEEVMNLLKKKDKVTVDELKVKLSELEKISEKDRKSVRDGIKEVLDKEEYN